MSEKIKNSGRVIVGGKEIGKDTDFADQIGIIIETPGFLNSYRGYKNLEYLASIKSIIGKREIMESMERVGLDPNSKKEVGKYSLGDASKTWDCSGYHGKSGYSDSGRTNEWFGQSGGEKTSEKFF